jgi:hypothetical protein
MIIDTNYGPWKSDRPLLSANSKLRRLPGRAGRYRAIGLAMAPAGHSGRNLCTWSTEACREACNGFFSGMNVTRTTRAALVGRAKLFHDHRAEFAEKLFRELSNFAKLCARSGVIPAVRLNVSTDIVWERILPEIFAEFPAIEFYDYTAALPRHRPTTPRNYALSHSWKETTTADDVASIVEAGRNLVVPFDSAWIPQRGLYGALPESLTIEGGARGPIALRCVNGDRHDIRLPAVDGRGVVVALHGKSGASRVDDATDAGFMLHHAEGAALRRRMIFRGMVSAFRPRSGSIAAAAPTAADLEGLSAALAH